MSLPLGLIEGVSIILVMLIVGLIFVAVIVLGELAHWLGAHRAQRRRGRRSAY